MIEMLGLWRPALGGLVAFGLAFLAEATGFVAVAALGLPRPAETLLWLGLLVPLAEEGAKLLLLRPAGGPARWGALGVGFGLCEAALTLARPAATPAASLAAALAAVLLHGALGRLAGAVALRQGRLGQGFGLAVLLHAMVKLAAILALVALVRHQGVPMNAAGGLVALLLALPLVALAAGSRGRYAAAAGRDAVARPNASASRR